MAIKHNFLFLTGIIITSTSYHALFAQNHQSKDTISIDLKHVEVLASYAKNKVKEPVMVSSINKEQVFSRLSTLEFPEIMKDIPSTYISRKGGGYGDSRITLRGFSSENVGLTINGIPVNGMENGTVYWSNWAGLADVTSALQVQRGIGLSNRSIPSIGGTINIITMGAQAQRGGSVYYGIGNDGFEKMGINFSTGNINGWNFTFAGSHTTGNGYVNGTDFDVWSYYGELAKRINSKHSLSLTVLGAPQWHNGNGYKQTIETYENSADGIRLNKDYGYLNGKVISTSNFGYNKYHKPQISLNHYWNITDYSSLRTSVYASIAEGGGQKVYGLNQKTPNGLTDFDAIMKANGASDKGSTGYMTMSTNAHDWYGLISTYSHSFNNEFSIKGGFDGRYYKGYHYEELSNLLGGAYYLDTKGLAYRPTGEKLKVGDIINSDYSSFILQYGAFGEAVYETDYNKAFVSFVISDHAYKRKDKGKYGPYSDPILYPISMMETKWKHFVPVSLRAGYNHLFTDNHRVFANIGYSTRAPKMDNVYVDNKPLADLVMEKSLTAEIGYGFHNKYIDASINGYYIRWYDKSTTIFNKELNERMCIPNIDAIHKGIEIEVAYRPIYNFKVGGFFSLGDWRWANDVSFTKVDAQSNKIGTYNAYIRDLRVGDAPQTSVGLNATWTILKGLEVGADFNYYARHYANFYPDARTSEQDRADSWRLPDYGLFNLNAKYNFKIGPLDAVIYGNVNNLFNKKYISDAQDGKDHGSSTATVWYGFGRTWSTCLKIIF